MYLNILLQIVVTEVLLSKLALQITYMQFSDHKKQMLVGKYSTEFRELVNAHLHESQARINNLCESYEADKVKISDLQALVGLAQDFAAAYQLLEGMGFEMPEHEIKDEQVGNLRRIYS